eukprot:8361724-Pyramimonas_sp.AAC.2
MHPLPAPSTAGGGRDGAAVEPCGRRAGKPRNALPPPRSSRPPGWPGPGPPRPRPHFPRGSRGGGQYGPSPGCRFPGRTLRYDAVRKPSCPPGRARRTGGPPPQGAPGSRARIGGAGGNQTADLRTAARQARRQQQRRCRRGALRQLLGDQVQ